MSDTKAQEYVAQLKELFPTSMIRLCDEKGEQFQKSREFEAASTVIVEVHRVARFRGTKDEVLSKAKAKHATLVKPEFD